jgi:hypothetical protein
LSFHALTPEVRNQHSSIVSHFDSSNLQGELEQLFVRWVSFYCGRLDGKIVSAQENEFFLSIQALQFQHPSTNIGELVGRVLRLYQMYPHVKLNNVFFTLQTCMNQIIEANGSNDYQIMHMNKARLEILELLPQSIEMADAADDWFNGNASEDDSDSDEDE